MKTAKKFLAMLLVLAVIVAFGATAFADASNPTITITNAVQGHTYTLYKIFDAATDANGRVTYSLPAGKTAADITGDANANNWFSVNATGGVTPKAAFTETVLKSDAFKTWAESFGTEIDSKVAGATGTVAFNRLDYGYYYVTSTLGTAVTVDTSAPDVEIVDKNQKPDWPPPEDGGGKKVNNASANTAKLDEILDFSITVDATNYDGDKKVFRYEITDTMDPGMTYTQAPSVTVDGVAPAAGTTSIEWLPAAAAGAPATTMANATGFKVTVAWTNDGTNAGNSTSSGDSLYANAAKLVVSYKAKLDSAKVNDIDTVDANKNTATFAYYAGVPGGPDPTTPTGESPSSTSETYTTNIQILKVDGDNNNVPLAGAEFTLTSNDGSNITIVSGTRFVVDAAASPAYWELTDGTYTNVDPATPGVDTSVYVDVNTKYRKENFNEVKNGATAGVDMKGTVDPVTGALSFGGLIPGTYTLEETVVPAGYSKAADVVFTLSFDAATKKWSSSNTNVTVVDGANGGGSLSTTVVNSSSIVMPSTGGVGTTIFYILGSALLLGAAVLLITRKRMSSEG